MQLLHEAEFAGRALKITAKHYWPQRQDDPQLNNRAVRSKSG